MNLLQRFRAWLEARHQRHDNRRFRDGYDMAARQLRERGAFAARDLENAIDAEYVFGNPNKRRDPFDDGVRAAIRQWRRNA